MLTLTFSLSFRTLINHSSVGPEHSHSTRPNLVPISGDAVYTRRGDHRRVEHERVCFFFFYLPPNISTDIILRAEIAKYDKLKKNYEDPTYEVVSSVFRALAGKKIIGSGSFQRYFYEFIIFLLSDLLKITSNSRDGHPGFKANLKAVQGDLFMLERYIFFVSKSPLLIELSDIHQVVFSRVGAGGASAAAGRTFDIKIVTKSGPEHSFTSINKEEHEIVEAYLRDKKIRVKNEMVPDADLLLAAVVDDDDDDMQSVVSDDSDDRGKSKPKAPRGDDDDESEEDGKVCFLYHTGKHANDFLRSFRGLPSFRIRLWFSK